MTVFLRELRRRLLVIIFVAVLPILGWIFYQSKLSRDVQIMEALEDAWGIVENVGIREARFIDSAKQLLTLLSDISELTSTDPAVCRRLLQQLVEHNKIYVDLGVADASGEVRCRAEESEAGALKLASSSHYRGAVNAKSFAIGDYQLHGQSNRKSLNFAYPIVDQNRALFAVIFAALDVSWIGQLAAESKLPEGVALSILDSKGTLLARFPEPEKWVGKHIPDVALFEMLQLRSQAAKDLIGLDGVDRFYAFKPLSVSGAVGQMYVMVGIPKDVVFGPVNRALMRNLLLLFLVSSLATAIAWLIGSKSVVGFVMMRARSEEARAQLAAIVESSEDAIIGMTLDGIITSWNDGAEATFGHAAADVIGREIVLLIPHDRRSEIPELLGIVRRGKGINRYETERLHRNGERIYVSASFSPIRDALDNVIGASTIARDISLLRKGEEQLQAHTARLEMLHAVAQDVGGTLSMDEVLMRALKRLVSESGFDFAFVHFSQELAGRKWCGASFTPCSAEELESTWRRLGEEFNQCVWECRNPWFVDKVAAVPELAVAAANDEVRALAVLPLTRGKQFSAVMTLLSSQEGGFGVEDSRFLHAVSRQIALAIENAWLYSGTIQTNMELRREIDERKRAERTLADFTAMVAHDLRSPLANVVSMTESINEGLFGPVTELQSRWLRKIENNCRSLINHVSDFLDFSKIEAGKLQLVKAPVDLAALINENLLDYSLEADKRRIALKRELSDRVPTLSLDRGRIGQVLSNLLSNAFKFTDNGGEIEVAARADESLGAIIWVKDSGAGIPRQELDNIFDLYRQVSGEQNSYHRGTGLGLAICKKIVEAHGGRIWVESEARKGSTFYFSLPGAIGARDAQSARCARQIHPSP